jgi:hypothetical protein
MSDFDADGASRPVSARHRQILRARAETKRLMRDMLALQEASEARLNSDRMAVGLPARSFVSENLRRVLEAERDPGGTDQ